MIFLGIFGFFFGYSTIYMVYDIIDRIVERNERADKEIL